MNPPLSTLLLYAVPLSWLTTSLWKRQLNWKPKARTPKTTWHYLLSPPSNTCYDTNAKLYWLLPFSSGNFRRVKERLSAWLIACLIKNISHASKTNSGSYETNGCTIRNFLFTFHWVYFLSLLSYCFLLFCLFFYHHLFASSLTFHFIYPSFSYSLHRFLSFDEF